MSRFTLSPDAERDMDEMIDYLDALPEEPALRIGRAVQRTLQSIATQPELGRLHAAYSTAQGREVRSRVCSPFLIYYAVEGKGPLLIAVLHGRRDIATILSKRIG